MRTSFWTRLFDLVSPRTCLACGERLSPNEQVLCPVCHLHLPLTHYEHSPLDNPLARLFWGHFDVEHAAALFYYEPHAVLSHLIYAIKYNGRKEAAQAMGTIMARQFAAEGFFDGIEALVPMPITWRRKWKRGYNQSTEIARGVERITGIPVVTKAVRRVRFQASQTSKHARERLENVENSFQLVHADSIAGKHILLIDDIITTGATVTACATELQKAPGVSISIMALGFTKS